jgi:hypothetical protein
MTRLLPLLAATVLLAAACVPEPEAGPAPPTSVPVDIEPIGEGALLPGDPAPDEGIRARRRMDIDQLNASIRAATGGQGWTEGTGDDEVDLFVELGPTLGVPDYLDRTNEDLTASLLFEKFLGDAARSVCAKVVGKELALPLEPRVLMVYVDVEQTWDDAPAEVETNLRYLLLRYHGTSLDDDDVARLEPWTWLFRSTVHASGSPAKGWEAVCVALITHPDFYTY